MEGSRFIIAVCDDEEYVLEELERVLNRYIIEQEKDFCIKIYETPQELLENIDNIDVLFLDVEMPEKDGFQVAEQIRLDELNIKVIFVSSHTECVQRALEVKAFRYLYKPLMDDEIIKSLENAIDELEKDAVLSVGKEYEQKYVRIHNIFYIEALGDGSAICLKDKTIVSTRTLQYWEQKLHKKFCRCHRSYLINFFNVTMLEKNKIILKNEKTIPISYRKRKTVEKQYFEFIKRNARVI